MWEEENKHIFYAFNYSVLKKIFFFLKFCRDLQLTLRAFSFLINIFEGHETIVNFPIDY